MDSDRRRVFFEVHRDLPREGPGNRASTLRALEHVLDALHGERPVRVVDVGCGPGMQTLDLTERLTDAHVVAMDLHAPFVQRLARRVERDDAPRVTPVVADMRRLPFADAAVDLVWCEGAAYVMGVAEALDAWQRVLRPGGACAFTEAVWLGRDPPQPLRQFWSAYPAMGDVDGCRDLIRRHGFELVADFVLPPEAWWDDYYTPMSARIAELEQQHQDEVAASVLAECRREIDIRRRYGEWYGYAFFIARRPARS